MTTIWPLPREGVTRRLSLWNSELPRIIPSPEEPMACQRGKPLSAVVPVGSYDAIGPKLGHILGGSIESRSQDLFCMLAQRRRREGLLGQIGMLGQLHRTA